MKTIDNKELILALAQLEEEKGIKKEYLLESIEAALVTAYKRNFDSVDNVKIIMDDKTGDIQVYCIKEAVEEVEEPQLQIILEEAKKYNKKVKVGETVEIEIIPKDFGRIAAQTAKQVIIQKIREEERNVLYSQFNERKSEIVSGIVQKADGGTVILDLGRLEGIMPIKEQIPTENYRVNDKVKGYVVEVERGLKGTPQVIVSRAHQEFIKKLFEFEIPEIYEGLIEIKSVSRDPGNRSKVAVYSTNENIDPVGSCVGQKGVRIQNIINELSGEKIDVIEWNQDPSIFIASALLPARVLAVDIKEEERFAQVIVPDDQLSLAIGKAGQNARLAAKLTNWKIDIKSETQFREIIMKLQEEAEKQAKSEELEVNKESEIMEVDLPEEEKEKEETSKKIEEKPKRGRKKKEETALEKEKVKKPEKKAVAKKTTTKKSKTKKETTKKEDEKKTTNKKKTTKKTEAKKTTSKKKKEE